MRTMMTYTQRNTTTSALGVIGLVQYLDNLPLYLDAYYNLYIWSRILAVDVHIECINNDGSPYDFVLGVCPYGATSTISIAQLKETQGAIVKSIGGTTGMSRIIVRKRYNVPGMMKFNMGRNYAMTLGDARSTSYLDSSLPVAAFVPSIITGAAVNGISITVTLKYHVEFFERQVPALSTLSTSYPRLASPLDPTSSLQVRKTCEIDEKKPLLFAPSGVKSIYVGNLWPDVPIPPPDVDIRAILGLTELKPVYIRPPPAREIDGTKYKPQISGFKHQQSFEKVDCSDPEEEEDIEDEDMGVYSREELIELIRAGDDVVRVAAVKSRKPLDAKSASWVKKQ